MDMLCGIISNFISPAAQVRT